MHTLLNFIFGWDYIAWRNYAHSGIARVYVDGMGKPYYFRYRLTKLIDPLPSNNHTIITWLTCSPNKYIK